MANTFFDPNMMKQFMPKQGLGGAPVFDMAQMMETQRKNVQAMTDAMQLSMEAVQQAITRQAELMSRMVSDNSGLASCMMTEGTPEQKVQRQAEMMRKSYETSMCNAREVSGIITKSSEDAAEIINRRVTATLAEFKTAFEAAPKSAPVQKSAANQAGAAKKSAKGKKAA